MSAEYKHQWYLKNKERILAKRSEYHFANREMILARQKTYNNSWSGEKENSKTL